MSVSLFEYAVIKKEKNKKGEDTGRGEILVGITSILARNEAEVRLVAAREIPSEVMDELDQVEVVVRPFVRSITSNLQPFSRSPYFAPYFTPNTLWGTRGSGGTLTINTTSSGINIT